MPRSSTDGTEPLIRHLLLKFPSVQATLDKLSALNVVRGVTGKEARVDFSADELADCRAFLYLADSVRSEILSGAGAESLQNLYDRVAEAFENFPKVLDREDERRRRLRSAPNYVGASKLSAAYILACSADEQELEDKESPVGSYLSNGIAALLRHDYKYIREKLSLRALRALTRNVLAEEQETTGVKSALLVSIGSALSFFARFAVENDLGALTLAEQQMGDASYFADLAGDAHLGGEVAELEYLIRSLPVTYSRQVLSPWEDLLGKDYLRVLTRGSNAIHQLWPSQIEALEKGLLNASRVAISMPTSSGKTLLAEMKIAAALSAHPGACVVYVVPLTARGESQFFVC